MRHGSKKPDEAPTTGTTLWRQVLQVLADEGVYEVPFVAEQLGWDDVQLVRFVLCSLCAYGFAESLRHPRPSFKVRKLYRITDAGVLFLERHGLGPHVAAAPSAAPAPVKAAAAPAGRDALVSGGELGAKEPCRPSLGHPWRKPIVSPKGSTP